MNDFHAALEEPAGVLDGDVESAQVVVELGLAGRGEPGLCALAEAGPHSAPEHVQGGIDVRALLGEAVGDVAPEVVGAVGVLEYAVDDHVHAGVEGVHDALGRGAVGRGEAPELVGLVDHGGELVDIEGRQERVGGAGAAALWR